MFANNKYALKMPQIWHMLELPNMQECPFVATHEVAPIDVEPELLYTGNDANDDDDDDNDYPG